MATRPLLVALLAACACSVSVSGPPDRYDPRGPAPPDCTTSRSAPAVDTVGAGLFGIVGIAFLASKCGPGDHDQDVDQTCEGITNAFGVVLLIPATIYAMSAIVGFGRTGRCRDATEQHRRLHPVRPRG
jgi:hypothetical protein